MPMSDQQRNLYVGLGGPQMVVQDDVIAAGLMREVWKKRANPYGYVPGTRKLGARANPMVTHKLHRYT